MIKVKYIIAIAALLVLPLAVVADPFKDLVLEGHRAGWYPNTHGGKTLTCPETCKAQVGGLAEYEASPGVAKRAFVCKVQVGSEGNIQTWLYGSQFDDRKACYTVDVSLKGKYDEKYFCLCLGTK